MSPGQMKEPEPRSPGDSDTWTQRLRGPDRAAGRSPRILWKLAAPSVAAEGLRVLRGAQLSQQSRRSRPRVRAAMRAGVWAATCSGWEPGLRRERSSSHPNAAAAGPVPGEVGTRAPPRGGCEVQTSSWGWAHSVAVSFHTRARRERCKGHRRCHLSPGVLAREAAAQAPPTPDQAPPTGFRAGCPLGQVTCTREGLCPNAGAAGTAAAGKDRKGSPRFRGAGRVQGSGGSLRFWAAVSVTHASCAGGSTVGSGWMCNFIDDAFR